MVATHYKQLNSYVMKRVSLLFAVVAIGVSSLCAQPKWSVKATGALGASVNYGSYSDWGYRDDVYDNSELFCEGSLGVRAHLLKWLYLGVDVSYSRFDNKYDSYFVNSIFGGKKLTLDGVGVSVVSGFTFPNKTRFYPFVEIGFMPFLTINDDFYDRNVYFGMNSKLGGGIKLTNTLALELALSSTALYRFGSDRDYHYDYYYDDEYSFNMTYGIGGSLGLVVSF